jgi:hypothetical protein
MGTYPQVPLTRRLERRHLLDVVRVEMMQLKAVLEEDPRMNHLAGTEKPRSWKATNEATYPLGGRDTDSSSGTLHSTTAVSEGSCPASTRRISCSRDTLNRVQFDMVVVKSRASWWH